MADNSLTIERNRFFVLVLKSPIQRGSLSIINSVTNISRLGTFKTLYNIEHGVHFIMMVKSAQPGVGGRCTPPLLFYPPSRAKLWCALHLIGEMHSPYFSSTPICTLWYWTLYCNLLMRIYYRCCSIHHLEHNLHYGKATLKMKNWWWLWLPHNWVVYECWNTIQSNIFTTK